MNSLTILLIALIIILASYFIYKNYQEYNVLEKFSTQSSLSTYFQNTVDSDDYQTYTNTFNGTNIPISNTNIIKPVGWNGVWKDSNNYIYSQFLQVNDKLIVVLTDYNYSSLIADDLLPTPEENPTGNLFIGIANLNSNRKIFRITNVISNTFNNSILSIGNDINSNINNVYFTGQLNITNPINNSTITLYPNNYNSNSLSITLNLENAFTGYGDSTNINLSSDYPYLTPYMNQISPFLQSNPMITNNQFDYQQTICTTGTHACYDQSNGYSDLSYINGLTGYNGCCDDENNVTCFFNTSYIGESGAVSIPKCTNNSQLYFYQNYNSQNYLLDTVGNSLNICNLLNYFTNTNGNVAILCYITNLTNVQTLTYQFFGINSNESTLNLQYDTMNTKLKNSLNKYQNQIKDITGTSGINLTNCLESSNSNNMNDIRTNCINTVQEYITNNNPPINVNASLLPTVWEINLGSKNNLINSCPFILNTSKLYNNDTTPIKFVECNDDRTINLSLNGGGNNQNLYMQDTTILNTGPIGNTVSNYYAISTNIRANNGLFLVPSNELGGFYNSSSTVSLAQSPEPNGKWLILGFTLSKLSQLETIINNYTF
jgi:hypothetical protein